MFTVYVIVATIFILGGIIQHFLVSKKPQYRGFAIQLLLALIWPFFSIAVFVMTIVAVIAYFGLACRILYITRFRR